MKATNKIIKSLFVLLLAGATTHAMTETAVPAPDTTEIAQKTNKKVIEKDTKAPTVVEKTVIVEEKRSLWDQLCDALTLSWLITPSYGYYPYYYGRPYYRRGWYGRHHWRRYGHHHRRHHRHRGGHRRIGGHRRR